MRSAADPPAYLPARDPALIAITEILDSVRAAGEDRFLAPNQLPTPDEVDAVLDRVREVTSAAIGTLTLRDLAIGAEVNPPGHDRRVSPTLDPGNLEIVEDATGETRIGAPWGADLPHDAHRAVQTGPARGEG